VFCIGLFKKVVIADTFAIWADAGFDSTHSLTFFEAWGATLSYTFQLYYDFSGYTDMAIGAALFFNITLPINFNSPYKAVNIQDFWRRWHITLSNWLRDYIYIPLGGNRLGEFRTFGNIAITFLIGGLWHGAGWTFVIWGALHGGALIVHRLWTKTRIVLPRLFAWAITFLFVNVAWVFFRAESLDSALRMLKSLFSLEHFVFGNIFVGLLNYLSPFALPTLPTTQEAMIVSVKTLEHLAVFGLVALILPNSMQMINVIRYQGRLALTYQWRWVFFVSLALFFASMTFVGNVMPSKFLYFNF